MDQADNDLLATLTTDDSHRPWSLAELERQLEGDPTDALGRLARDGLIHRLGDFVRAARAAVRAEALHHAC